MACNTVSGRLVSCKDSVGGIINDYIAFYNFYFATVWVLATNNNGLIDTLANSDELFVFDVRPNSSSYTSNITTDPATGSTAVEQVAELAFHKIDDNDFKSLQALIVGRFQAFVLDANHNVHCMGYFWGAECSGGAMVTGQAKGDMSGFNITLTANEPRNIAVKKGGGIPGTSNYPFDGLTYSGGAAITLTNGSYPTL
mgnify:CR=1 FL=1